MGGGNDVVLQNVRAAAASIIEGERVRSRSYLMSIDERQLDLEMRREEGRALSEAERVGERQGARIVAPLGSHGLRPSKLAPIFRRDEFTCRFEHCRRATVAPPVLRLLDAAHHEILRYDPHWKGSHCLFWLYSATGKQVADVPTSTNPVVVTACYWCHQTKPTPADPSLGWSLSPSAPALEWDGLFGLLPDLYSALEPNLTTAARRYCLEWVRALRQV